MAPGARRRPKRAGAQAAGPLADRAPSPRRRRPRSPRRSAASGTGTTATRGSATPRSRSARCSASAAARRREAFFWWLMHASQLTRPRLQVLYRLDGGTRAEERSCTSRATAVRPVRVGNGAVEQTQLDIYGELLQTRVAVRRRPVTGSTASIGDGGSPRSPTSSAGTGASRTRDLGGTRRAAALHPVEDDVLGRARPRGRLAEAGRIPAATWPLARERGRDRGVHRGPLLVRRAAELHPVGGAASSTPACCSARASGTATPRASASGARSTRCGGTWATGAPLPLPGRRRTAGRGGRVPVLLVLARGGPRDGRAA